MSASNTNIDSVLHEQRKFECPEQFREQAHIKSLEDYERIYQESIEQPEKFWGRIASDLHWFKKWDKVLEWNNPWAKWFVGGELNLSYNCVDRHALSTRGSKPALALCISCAGRKQILGSRTQEEARIVNELLANVPAVGFYGYGEIARLAKDGISHYHNETFTTLLLGGRVGSA